MKLSLVSPDHPILRQKTENFDFDSVGGYDPKELFKNMCDQADNNLAKKPMKKSSGRGR